MPNTFIIGAAKSGTTSLYHFLRQHPDVFMSAVKEPRFFAYAENPPAMVGPGDEESNREAGAVFTLEAYQALFSEATSESVVGEASPVYLYDPDAPQLISQHCPGATLIAVLRNPIERAYSHFLHLVRSGREPRRDFEAALDAEDERVAAGWEWSWHYRRMGFYGEQLRRYLQHFDADQIHVYLFEELKSDAVGLAQEIYRVLGIDPGFEPRPGPRRRTTGFPRSEWLQAFIHSPDHPVRVFARRVLPESIRDWALTSVKNANLEKPPMSEAARLRLASAYKEDVKELETMLERDLSDWLTTA